MKSAFTCKQLCHNSVFVKVTLITRMNTDFLDQVTANGGKMSLEDMVVLCSGNLELESKQKIFDLRVKCTAFLL